ncbi:MAG TPA: SCO1664 family protein, partial [Candidatus Dormibacteraeota bacterium]|nr:SCO1664 family protein [Candidatus Dormibacteraeota bacterium]
MLGRITRECPPPEAPQTVEAVYKPTAGERALDDFPDATLSRREVAAFLVSEATGWGIVPPTVLRDGPFGEGALQLWIDIDESVDVVAMVVEDDPRLRRMAAFDAAINNTDRKGGHVLPIAGGHVYGVDHGVCFSSVPKLRTVLWGWRGQPFTEDELAGLRRIA